MIVLLLFLPLSTDRDVEEAEQHIRRSDQHRNLLGQRPDLRVARVDLADILAQEYQRHSDDAADAECELESDDGHLLGGDGPPLPEVESDAHLNGGDQAEHERRQEEEDLQRRVVRGDLGSAWTTEARKRKKEKKASSTCQPHVRRAIALLRWLLPPPMSRAC